MAGVINISTLGARGRAGNSFFQYAFAKGYAAWSGATLHTPDWWGRRIFPEAAADPLIDRVLPQTICDSVCQQMGHSLLYFAGKVDIDLTLYAQHQCFLDYYTRAQCREWFRMLPEFESYAPNRDITGPYSAAHLRRGDYTKPPFNKLYCTVSNKSYEDAVKQFQIPEPIFSIFEGCRPPIADLEALGIDWLVDFLLLRDADYLLRANSSFSWWAATLGHGKTYSPVVDAKVGHQTVGFVHGNHPTLAGGFQNQSDLVLREQ